MGYWPKEAETPVTLAVACRYLLEVVLSEAGFSRDTERVGIEDGTRRTKCLIDPGFGCGNQTMYLMSEAPVLPCEETGGMSDRNASYSIATSGARKTWSKPVTPRNASKS
jgi:hypothetical protein